MEATRASLTFTLGLGACQPSHVPFVFVERNATEGHSVCGLCNEIRCDHSSGRVWTLFEEKDVSARLLKH